MLRKTLSSLSADGRCVSTLLVVWPEASQYCSLQLLSGTGSWGGNVGFWEVSHKLVFTKNTTASVCPCCESQSPPTSTGDPLLPADKCGPDFYVVTIFFSPGSWCSLDYTCALPEWNFCFSYSCGIPVIKPCWLSKQDSLGPPPSITRPSSRENWCGAQDFSSS